MDLPAYIRIKLREKNWTVYKLQKLTGIHRSTLARIVNGAIRKPSYESLVILAQAFGVDVQALLIASGQAEEMKSMPKPSLPAALGRDIPIVSEIQANQYQFGEKFIFNQEYTRVMSTVGGAHAFALRLSQNLELFQTNDLLILDPEQPFFDGAIVALKGPQLPWYFRIYQLNTQWYKTSLAAQIPPLTKLTEAPIGVGISLIRSLYEFARF